MAGVRMTGLVSGIDTESIVGQLSEAYQKKVDTAKKEQTKLEWKKEAWTSLNTKIMDFYKGALSDFRSTSTYRTKTATGDLTGVKVTAGNNAANGTHEVKVKHTAKAQMWTGRKLNVGDNAGITGSTKLTDLGIAEGTEITLSLGKNQTAAGIVTIDETTTLSGLATQLAKYGIDANYDAGQGRFYLNSKGTGEDNQFQLSAVGPNNGTTDALTKLGLDLAEGEEGRVDAQDAEIVYNGVTYKQSSSTFNINGLTIEALAETEGEKPQTFTVGTDVQGIYDKVKAFTKAYNTLIDEMNTLYDAKKVKDYEPLTDDEKKAMSEDEIKNWESVIKASLLRRDDTISSLLSNMRSTLSQQVSVTSADGTTRNYSLASFGINTSTYTEHGKLHIYGDKEDSDFADYDDELMKAITENPNAVEKTLAGLGTQVYNSLMKAMNSNRDLSSALTFYNDKQLDKEIDEYKGRVTTLQEKMVAEEDKYYKQFSAMETAMAKLQSQQTYISQLFGVG